jgi:hypothetical protein
LPATCDLHSVCKWKERTGEVGETGRSPSGRRFGPGRGCCPRRLSIAPGFPPDWLIAPQHAGAGRTGHSPAARGVIATTQMGSTTGSLLSVARFHSSGRDWSDSCACFPWEIPRGSRRLPAPPLPAAAGVLGIGVWDPLMFSAIRPHPTCNGRSCSVSRNPKHLDTARMRQDVASG